LINVLTVGPSVGAAVGDELDGLGGVVGDGEGGFVGKGVDVGKNASVAVASGEQAANPLAIPNAPTFKASLREIFLILVIYTPLKSVFTKRIGDSKSTRHSLCYVFIPTLH
jgi:hypothetical protein